MALNKLVLKEDVKRLLIEMSKDNTSTPEAAAEVFAGRLADAIDAYVKSGTITANPAAVTSAAMSNSGGPVVASNNLISTIS